MNEFQWQVYRFQQKWKGKAKKKTLRIIFKIAWDNHSRLASICAIADAMLGIYLMGKNEAT